MALHPHIVLNCIGNEHSRMFFSALFSKRNLGSVEVAPLYLRPSASLDLSMCNDEWVMPVLARAQCRALTIL